MKKILSILVILSMLVMLMSSIAFAANSVDVVDAQMSKATIKDYEEITEVLNGYIKGVASGKSEVMKPAFYKEATMYGYVQGVGLREGSIQNLYNSIDQGGPAQDLKARIDILGVEGTVASARVVLENTHGATYTDFHHLFKKDGEWKVISKIFYQHSDAQKSRATIKDYEEITEVLNGYVKGVALGKSEVLKPSFHKNATIYGYVGGVGLIEGPIQQLYTGVDQAGPAQGIQARIDILDIEGTVASTRVVLGNLYGHTYTDFHQLLKVDGHWKVISKIFHEHS